MGSCSNCLNTNDCKKRYYEGDQTFCKQWPLHNGMRTDISHLDRMNKASRLGHRFMLAISPILSKLIQ